MIGLSDMRAKPTALQIAGDALALVVAITFFAATFLAIAAFGGVWALVASFSGG